MAVPAAQAHARLVATEPGDGAVVARAPTAVTLRFDDAVRVLGGTTVVRNSDRRSVVAGKPRASGRRVVIPVKKLPDGDYTVRWRVLSDDGHTIEGVFAFAIGAGRAPPTAALAAGGGEPSATNVISRWLFFAGLLVAVGTAIFLLLAWRPARHRAGIGDGDDAPLWALMFAGFFLAFLGISGLLPHHGGSSTRFGLLMEIGGVTAIAGATLAAVAVVERRVGWGALAAAAFLLPVPSLAGHALDRGQLRPLNAVADVLHVGAAAVWAGGLLALAVGVPRVVRRLDAGRRAAFLRTLVPRLSAIGLASVAVIAATGLIRVLSELSAVSQLWSTGYGRALLVKTGLLAGAVTLAWLNRRRLAYTLSLRRNVVGELVLLAGVVVAVAFLTDLAPGRQLARAVARPPAPKPIHPPPRGAAVLAAQSGSIAVGLAALPSGVLEATALGEDGGVDGLAVSFRRDSRTVASARCGPGCYRSTRRIGPGRVTVVLGGSPPVTFDVPRKPQPASALVARARRAFGGLKSVVIDEHLASSPTQKVFTVWRIAAPNRLAYVTSGGARAVVIGARRWDKFGARPWEKTPQTPLRQPAAWWSPRSLDAYALGWTRADGRRARLVSFYDPSIPAWFEVAVDPRTALPLGLKMTAAAHFMRHRYRAFNRPLRIVPPS